MYCRSCLGIKEQDIQWDSKISGVRPPALPTSNGVTKNSTVIFGPNCTMHSIIPMISFSFSSAPLNVKDSQDSSFSPRGITVNCTWRLTENIYNGPTLAGISNFQVSVLRLTCVVTHYPSVPQETASAASSFLSLFGPMDR